MFFIARRVGDEKKQTFIRSEVLPNIINRLQPEWIFDLGEGMAVITIMISLLSSQDLLKDMG